ncbi:hypothetical protein LLG96_01925 [bacterium]|nr:hypothetical protein [bacterium]
MNNNGSDEVKLFDLLDTREIARVLEEVEFIISLVYPVFDYRLFEIVYTDVIRLYHGAYPGYKESNTEYHDLTHTLDTLIALARLIHGYSLGKESISERSIQLGLISALMHDTGYIQTVDDTSGTGAKYTLKHISRSIDFMEQYFAEHDFSREDFDFCSNCILCTNINTKPRDMVFSNHEEEVIGKMLGMADLLGQMSGRIYLEKLIYLYAEFQEGNVNGFESELDLLQKTIGFFELTQKRFTEDLGNLDKYLVYHFKARWNIDSDLYSQTFRNNNHYLKFILEQGEKKFYHFLRRENFVNRFDQEGMLPAIG